MNKNSKTIKNLCEIYNFGKCHNSIKVELTITQGEANITEICKRFNQMDVRDISDIKESDGNMLETMLDKLAPEDRYRELINMRSIHFMAVLFEFFLYLRTIFFYYNNKSGNFYLFKMQVCYCPPVTSNIQEVPFQF